MTHGCNTMTVPLPFKSGNCFELYQVLNFTSKSGDDTVTVTGLLPLE